MTHESIRDALMMVCQHMYDAQFRLYVTKRGFRIYGYSNADGSRIDVLDCDAKEVDDIYKIRGHFAKIMRETFGPEKHMPVNGLLESEGKCLDLL